MPRVGKVGLWPSLMMTNKMDSLTQFDTIYNMKFSRKKKNAGVDRDSQHNLL